MNLICMNSGWTDDFHLKPYEIHDLSKNTIFSPVYQAADCALTVVSSGTIQNDADLMPYRVHIQASWKNEVLLTGKELFMQG